MPKARYPILVVDLAERKTSTFEPGDEVRRLLLGGKGLGAKLLLDLLPGGSDPLGSDNPAMLLTGPLTGTLAPGTRACLVSKSPLTNSFCDSYFGGGLGAEIRYAGYDGIIIAGLSDEPVYVLVTDDRVDIKPARHLWGLDTFETYDAIRRDLGTATVRIACIGPAGENLVRFALVDCDPHRQAARGGLGAVWGAKKLKAVVVAGTGAIGLHDGALFAEWAMRAREEIRQSQTCTELTEFGSLSGLGFANSLGFLPTRNFTGGVFEGVDSLMPAIHRERLWIKNVACPGCPTACTKSMLIRRGKWKGTRGDNTEYESLGLLGSNLGISDAAAVSHLSTLCDRLGLDSVSAGGVVGFAIEAYQRGLISDGDLDLAHVPRPAFGDPDFAAEMIRSIAERTGVGAILAEGVQRAAASLGAPAERFAVHVKGLESPAWGPRGSAGMGLAYVMCDRGGCHQRAFPISFEQGMAWPGGLPLAPVATDNKAEVVVWEQNLLAGFYSLVACFYATTGVSLATYLRLLEGAVGLRLNEEEFLAVGERIWAITRMINLREGTTRSDDVLPPRFGEPLPDGPYAGHSFSETDVDKMVESYYEVRRWRQAYGPDPARLSELGLDGVVGATAVSSRRMEEVVAPEARNGNGDRAAALHVGLDTRGEHTE